MNFRASRSTSVSAAITLAAAAALPGLAAETGYVSNTDSDTVTVVNLATMTEITEPINVGNEPRGLAATPSGAFVYVPNRFSASVSVISTASNSVVATVPLTGSEPYNLVVTPDGTKVYVVCKASSTVSVLSTASNTEINSITLSGEGPSPEGVAITPDGSKVYVVNRQANSVDVIDTSTDSLVAGPIPVGSNPRDAAVSTDGTRVIVVGEGIPAVIRTSDDTIVETAFTDIGNQRDVAVAGDRAFVTNFSGSLDVYDLSTLAFQSSISLSGSTPYAVAVNPAGTRGWVTFADSSALHDVDLVQMSEGEGSVTTGSGPRGVAAVLATEEIEVVSYFLPKAVKVRIAGEGKDSLVASGFFDDGGGDVNLGDPVTLAVGDFQRTFPLQPNAAGTVLSFKDASLSFSLKPNLKGSSRGFFRLKIAKTTLSGLVDPDAPVDLVLSGTGLPGARSRVGLTAGKYRLGRVRGTLESPEYFPAKAVVKTGDGKPDAISLKGGFRTTGGVPGALGTVRITVGEEFALDIPGGSFTRTGDSFRFTSRDGGTSVSVVLDFAREILTVKARGIELGALAGPTTDLVLDDGSGSGPVRIRVRLGSSGVKRFY
jgi:YVTN family beta-propeller protein